MKGGLVLCLLLGCLVLACEGILRPGDIVYFNIIRFFVDKDKEKTSVSINRYTTVLLLTSGSKQGICKRIGSLTTVCRYDACHIFYFIILT